MLSNEIRTKFLEYFEGKGHTIVPSSPVVPFDDPTLLFINAGMNQFKDVFLGEGTRDYRRATTSQKCIRVGGKHNDLENVGHTKRHLTFFEMLGNFSFGDYFKKETIEFAWEVSTEVFGLDGERIWVSVFREDDEAYELWKGLVPEARIVRLDEKDNFWAMGETGPCGPCSELLYDRGEKYGSAVSPYEDSDGERFPEFWNLVFMQYNRDGEKMAPLPNKSIDTGGGLERIVAFREGAETLFETDVLRGLIDRVEELSDVEYDPRNGGEAAPFRVVADHLRCLAFAIADGVQPSNVERGYVLRKVLRRAVRYGRQLGFRAPFLGELVPRLVETMGSAFPELKRSQDQICEILALEEEAFFRTLKRGGNLLGQVVEKATSSGTISGADAFKLKDTYGLPLEEILLLAKDSGLSVDLEKYQALELEARERSRAAHVVTQQVASQSAFEEIAPTRVGPGGKVIALFKDGERVDRLSEGEEGMVLLDETPFYAEMGGQVGDTGTLNAGEMIFEVNDCIAPHPGRFAHLGKVERGELKVGDGIEPLVDWKRRKLIERNHSATHLLNWALQKVLGEHVKQAGSIVAPDRLRFDFSHHKGVTKDELRWIEDLVNEKVALNLPVETYELSYAEAQKRPDIKQFFGEKYGDQVRVVDMDVSKELCGGCHVGAAGDVGTFRIASESSIAAGVRRIVAVTGQEALNIARRQEDMLQELAALLKTQPAKLLERASHLQEENTHYAKEMAEARRNQLKALAAELVDEVEELQGLPFIGRQVSVEVGQLRDLADLVMEQLKQGVIALGAAGDGNCAIAARVSDDLVKQGVAAGALVKLAAPLMGGGGGGKPAAAQAGGKQPENLREALEAVRQALLNR